MIRGFLETLILLIFFLGQPVAPDTAQSPPNSTGDSFFSTVEAHSDGPNIADPVSEACSSCWPLTGASLFPGARDFVLNNSPIVVQKTHGDRDVVAQGEV